MKRIAEMSDMSQVIRMLPRIKRHILNPDNMRWVHLTPDRTIILSYEQYVVYFYFFEPVKCPLQQPGFSFLFVFFGNFCNLTKGFWCKCDLWTVSHFKLKNVPYRFAVNATPQKMSDTAAQLESFMKDVAENRKERKPVRPNIIEVRLQQAYWMNLFNFRQNVSYWLPHQIKKKTFYIFFCFLWY